MKLVQSLCFALALSLVLVLPAYGQEDKPKFQDKTVKSPHLEVELISEVKSIQPGQPFWIAIRYSTIPHWHIYWQNSGDSGAPISVIWHLPKGYEKSEIHWPYPKKHHFANQAVYAYEGEELFLIKITPPKSAKVGTDIDVMLETDWLVCKEECFPGTAALKVNLPIRKEDPAKSQWAEKFAEARKKLPLDKSQWLVKPSISKKYIVLDITRPTWFEGELKSITFFPHQKGIIENKAPQKLSVTDRGYRIKITRNPNFQEKLKNLTGLLVTSASWTPEETRKSLFIDILNDEDLKFVTVHTEVSSIWWAFLLAFLGGMILNLMPCVLPVLSLKVLSFVQQAGESRAKVFQHGLVFTAGVLVSFWILAGALLLLRSGGQELGWGFQLQSPPFIIVLAGLIFLFGLNLFGLFEIGMGLTGVAGGEKPSGMLGSFVTGITATVVATPCTAPFMGASLGFALTQPAWASMAIFTFLGLGMAFPYVVLATFPQLLKFVPKPGRWMETLKQFMGFLLMATVVWLVWVLGTQTDVHAVGVLLVSLVILSLAAWIYGRWGDHSTSGRVRWSSRGVALVLAVVAFYSPIDFVQGSQGGMEWQKFSPQRVKELRWADKPVFINFTANWCLSCKFNERVVWSQGEVVDRFDKLGITPLKADWTKRGKVIADYLAQYKRSSVPFYILYPSRDGEPIIFPEALTPGMVLDRLRELEEKGILKPRQ